ncbi:MAG: thioredoxin fold domain-containing protein [Gammaproteobacteria bacterium]|nr:thioredoxin fold domain-containing protein [Gammaproteobacteria bacterium]
MFSLSSKKLKSGLLFMFAALSIFWIMDSSAKGLVTEVEEPLPYVVIKDGSNLAGDARESSKKQIPVLLFFSMKHCPFCIEVEEDYLKPMLRNAEYDGKVIIRKIRIDGTASVRDFSGKERDADEFSDDYNVSMVPTLILVDAHGYKLEPAIIGIANAHYYSSELDTAIDASTQKIRTIAKR